MNEPTPIKLSSSVFVKYPKKYEFVTHKCIVRTVARHATIQLQLWNIFRWHFVSLTSIFTLTTTKNIWNVIQLKIELTHKECIMHISHTHSHNLEFNSPTLVIHLLSHFHSSIVLSLFLSLFFAFYRITRKRQKYINWIAHDQ